MSVAAGMAMMAAMLRPRSPRCAVRTASTTAAGLCTPRHREGIGDSRRSPGAGGSGHEVSLTSYLHVAADDMLM